MMLSLVNVHDQKGQEIVEHLMTSTFKTSQNFTCTEQVGICGKYILILPQVSLGCIREFIQEDIRNNRGSQSLK